MTAAFPVPSHRLAASPPAVHVSAAAVDALCVLLADHGARHGAAMILPGSGHRRGFGCDFDARACLLSVSAIAACFDYDPAVIALVEEAQFQNRCLRIWQRCEGGRIWLDLSSTPDSKPTPEEAKLVREIEVLEARARHTLRLFHRSEDYLGLIDWTAMTKADFEAVSSRREELSWSLYELDHDIAEASQELWAYCY